MPDTSQQPVRKGRGWHGDSANHARVGAMGGKARSNNDQGSTSSNQGSSSTPSSGR